MKKIFYFAPLCALLLTSSTMVGGNADYELYETNNDTVKTKFSFAGHEVIVSENDIRFTKKEQYSNYNPEGEMHYTNWNFSGFWGFDFGMNNWGANVLSTNIDKESDKMELSTFRSHNFDLRIVNAEYNIIKNNFSIYSGVGLSFNSYSFSNKQTTLSKTDGVLAITYDTTTTYKKNKLKTSSLVVPLMFSLQTNSFMTERIGIDFGVEGRLVLGAKTKRVSQNDDTLKDKDDFYINPLSCNAICRLWFSDLGVYFSAALTPMFKENRGPVLYPYSVGISLRCGS